MSVSFADDQQERLEAIRRKEEEDLVVILSEKYGIGHADLRRVVVDANALKLIKEKDARAAEVAPYALQQKKVSVAIRTPNAPNTKRVLEELKNAGYVPTPVMVSRASLDRAWEHYKDISLASQTEAGVLDISGDEILSLQAKLISLAATRSAIDEVSGVGTDHAHNTSRILEAIMAGAMANNASDIHIEPEDEDVKIRFRIDGVLTPISSLSHEAYKPLLTRVKLVSGLKINIKSSAQDGRFSVVLGEKEIEIRTSILPGNYGESIVTRLLDPSTIGLPLEDLGIHPTLLEVFKREIARPNGMILNTGPTGSGKTTSLYAFLKKVHKPGIKILTIEDPIEYHVDGIVQTQVNHKDYTFASGLRSALRQDPDIIMVGEIRDREVSETAVHAALTGHLVFSTLHTNNAAGAFPRLVDIGVDPGILGSAVNMVMAQRLLRRLIPEKRKEVKIEGKDREFVDKILDGIKNRDLIPDNTDTMWVPDVPEGEVEYKGRIAVYETILSTREIEEAVRKRLSIRELGDVAHEQGFTTLHEDGILKVLEGVSTLDEVRRVLGEDVDTSEL